MSFNAQILADSLSPQGDRITTMKITFPRMILAEFNTHRMFSRNSASSRAIPFKRMVQMVEENPFIPIAWQKNHKGMQGTEYFTDKDIIDSCKMNWLYSVDLALIRAKKLSEIDITKQICNRLLEPFMWHTVIVTATEWENFFKLRCPQYVIEGINGNHPFRSKKDVYKRMSSNENFMLKLNDFTDLDWLSFNKSQAEIHIQAIAELMWDAMNESKPKLLEAGEWHIPFGDTLEELDSTSNKSRLELLAMKLNNTKLAYNEDMERLALKIATARCARISYETLGDNPKIDYEADIRLHDMLLESGHMSPFEHCARAMSDEEYGMFINGEDTGEDKYSYVFNKKSFGWCRNFKGFIQYRHLVEL